LADFCYFSPKFEDLVGICWVFVFLISLLCVPFRSRGRAEASGPTAVGESERERGRTHRDVGGFCLIFDDFRRIVKILYKIQQILYKIFTIRRKSSKIRQKPPTSLCVLLRSLSLSPTAVGPEASALPLERNGTQSNEIRKTKTQQIPTKSSNFGEK
jgi:hypothetical protein